MPFSVTWIALEIIRLSKLDRERQMSGYCLYVGRKIQMSLFTNTQQQTYSYQRAGGGGGDKLGV